MLQDYSKNLKNKRHCEHICTKTCAGELGRAVRKACSCSADQAAKDENVAVAGRNLQMRLHMFCGPGKPQRYHRMLRLHAARMNCGCRPQVSDPRMFAIAATNVIRAVT